MRKAKGIPKRRIAEGQRKAEKKTKTPPLLSSAPPPPPLVSLSQDPEQIYVR
jgi:hypothetical protein